MERKQSSIILCCAEDMLNASEIQQPEEQVASIEGKGSTETSVFPKQFSFKNIVQHAKKKSGKNAQSYVKKPLDKGYKCFYENYVFDVLCLLKDSEEYVKGSVIDLRERLKGLNVLRIYSAIVNKARCSCPAGEMVIAACN